MIQTPDAMVDVLDRQCADGCAAAQAAPHGHETGAHRAAPAVDEVERRRTEEALRDIGGRLISAQEEERSRIARELHDDLSQRLALLSIELEQVSQLIPARQSNLRSRMQDLWATAQEISVEVHRLSHQLHPSKLEHLGLVSAVRSFCEELDARRGIRINFSSRGVPADLPKDVALCVFRVVQESLRNVVKHSGAQEARVVLGMSGRTMQLSVSDSGAGFDVDSATHKKGLGLISMGERLRLVGGSITIRSLPSRGTRLEIQIPLAENPRPLNGGLEKS
jgi:signal transduction histidine kinase